MYSKRSNLVIGFHGCDESVANSIITGKTYMSKSSNDYDWLGNGIYFWENNLTRAYEFASEQRERTKNDKVPKVKTPAVIENLHALDNASGITPYDSVRGVFWEGEDLYTNAGFKEKNHIQICVRNPNCIKGFFKPLQLDNGYSKP